MSQKIPSRGWGRGPGNRSQNCVDLPCLRRNPQTTKSKCFQFFQCKLEDSIFSGFE